jgi:hypothetical protein
MGEKRRARSSPTVIALSSDKRTTLPLAMPREFSFLENGVRH